MDNNLKQVGGALAGVVAGPDSFVIRENLEDPDGQQTFQNGVVLRPPTLGHTQPLALCRMGHKMANGPEQHQRLSPQLESKPSCSSPLIAMLAQPITL